MCAPATALWWSFSGDAVRWMREPMLPFLTLPQAVACSGASGAANAWRCVVQPRDDDDGDDGAGSIERLTMQCPTECVVAPERCWVEVEPRTAMLVATYLLAALGACIIVGMMLFASVRMLRAYVQHRSDTELRDIKRTDRRTATTTAAMRDADETVYTDNV
jgi:hypothetical protein